MMDAFRLDNTQGYSQHELDQINTEWAGIVDREQLTEDSHEWKKRQAALLCEWDQRPVVTTN
jgi:hypothetical protein